MSIQQIREVAAEYTRWGDAIMLYPHEQKGIVEKQRAAGNIEFWFEGLSLLQGRVIMAAKAKVQPKADKAEFKGFVNYVLNDADKGLYEKWDIDDHDLWLLVAGHNQCGYKLSVSFNQQNDSFSATYMCNDAASPNAGYCLSAFAPDWYNCLKILAFKHEVVLDGVWGGAAAAPKNLWG